MLGKILIFPRFVFDKSYQYDSTEIESRLELNNIHLFVEYFDCESVVNIDTNHSMCSLYMYQSIEWWNEQVKGFEWVNPVQSMINNEKKRIESLRAIDLL